MQSFQNYIISDKINNDYILEDNLQYIDSAFSKIKVYIKNSANTPIVEGFRQGTYDVLFNINERIALTNFMYSITEHYMYTLMVENGIIDENLNEGLGDILKNTKEFLKKKSDQIQDKVGFLKERLNTLYKFLRDIAQGAIKSVKDLCLKFVSMMVKFGCSVSELIEKFKADKKAAQSELTSRIVKLLKLKELWEKFKNVFVDTDKINNAKPVKEAKDDKETSKNNEESSKKDKESSEEDEKNEYDYAAQAKAEYSKKNWGGLIGNVLMNTLINTIAHVAVCIVIPAIVTCIGGPFVGVLAEGLCKLLWAGPTIWKLFERQTNLWFSSEWDKYTTLQKWFSNLMFGIMLIWSIYKVWDGIKQIYDFGTAWATNAKDTLLPSANVQNMAKWINGIYKSLTGNNAKGFDEMVKVLDDVAKKEYKKLGQFNEETMDKKDVVKTKKDTNTEIIGSTKDDIEKEFEKTSYKSSTQAVKLIQKHAISASQLDKLGDNDTVTVALNGFFNPSKNEWSAKLVQHITEQTGMSKDEVIKILSDSHPLNKHLNGMCARAGSMEFWNVPAKVAKAINGFQTANGVEAVAIGAAKEVTNVVKYYTKEIIGKIGSWNWFDAFGFGPFEREYFATMNKSGKYFLLRIGSSKGKIYDIVRSENYTYVDAKNKFKDLNKDAFESGEQILRDVEVSIRSMSNDEAKSESLFDEYDDIIYESQDEYADQVDDINNEIENLKNKEDNDKIKKLEELLKNITDIIDKINKENEEIIEYNKKEKDKSKHKQLISRQTRNQAKRCKDNIENKLNKLKESNNKENKEETSEKETPKVDPDTQKNADNIADKQIEMLNKIKDKGIKTIMVLYGKPWKMPKENKKTNEDTELFDYSYDEYLYEDNEENKKDDEEVPVVLFNSLFMGAIDLVPYDKKGPRKHPLFLKGFEGSYEVLPKDGGMSKEEISNFFSDILYNSFMTCYNIADNKPIYAKKTGILKNKTKYEINPNYISGKLNFGGFTKEECLEIANSKGKPASKFLGASLYKSVDSIYSKRKHVTTEQDEKKRSEAVAIMAKDIKDNPKVKQVLDKYPNLKKNLLKSNETVDTDELYRLFNSINRIEQSYDPSKPKKTLFSRIKSMFKKLFGKDEKDLAKKYEPNEIFALAAALKSAKKQSQNTPKNESIEDSYFEDFRDWGVFEMANFEKIMKICNDECDDTEDENVTEYLKRYNLTLYIKRNTI